MSPPRILNLMLAAGPGGLETMALHYAAALESKGAQVLSVGLQGSWFAGAFAGRPDALRGGEARQPGRPADGLAAARDRQSVRAGCA